MPRPWRSQVPRSRYPVLACKSRRPWNFPLWMKRANRAFAGVALFQRAGSGSIAGSRVMQLFHHPFCPHSRFVRLVLGEYGIAADLIEETVLARRPEFLELNPAGTAPVLVDGDYAACGALVLARVV